MLHINLLLNPANRSWIIQKIAENLALHLQEFDVLTTISEKLIPEAHLVHHMSWAFANIVSPQPSTMFITHLDDIYKVRQVQAMLAAQVDAGICMSKDTMHQLIERGVSPTSLCYINPAHDGLIKPRKIVIGITSRIYSDGRKREHLLINLATRMPLDNFEFRIFGLGWNHVIPSLQSAGATVKYFSESDDFRKDYDLMQTEIPKFDYYLYLGIDEGSLGTLDALSAGVPTIVTPQGFHLDLPGGITHPVVSEADLEHVFKTIELARQSRVASVARLSWRQYASEHLRIWQSIIDGKLLTELETPENQNLVYNTDLSSIRNRSLYRNALQPRRIISTISHWAVMRKIRNTIDKIRFRFK